MSENVIILGAGFSKSAGIPLLGEFVDRMIDISVRGKVGGVDVPHEDLDLLRRAI